MLINGARDHVQANEPRLENLSTDYAIHHTLLRFEIVLSGRNSISSWSSHSLLTYLMRFKC